MPRRIRIDSCTRRSAHSGKIRSTPDSLISSPSRDDAPVLCVEFTEEATTLTGSSCGTLYRTLQHLGYGVFTSGPRAEDVQPFPSREVFPNVNLLASKDVAPVRARLAGKPTR